jgi:hypothetical protein
MKFTVPSTRLCHWLADVNLAAFAPAFILSLCESEAPANRRMRIVSVVMANTKK